jgi:hypothetical protein
MEKAVPLDEDRAFPLPEPHALLLYRLRGHRSRIPP